jgi:hypothetical protein
VPSFFLSLRDQFAEHLFDFIRGGFESEFYLTFLLFHKHPSSPNTMKAGLEKIQTPIRIGTVFVEVNLNMKKPAHRLASMYGRTRRPASR